jgi:hypothetical protein
LALGRCVPSSIPKVPARCHGGKTRSMHPGWIDLEHLKGVGGWEGVRWECLVGLWVGHGGGLGVGGQGRVVWTHLGGSRTTRQCSSMWVRPAEGSMGGFGVSWVSTMAGGAGCQERSRWVSRRSGEGLTFARPLRIWGRAGSPGCHSLCALGWFGLGGERWVGLVRWCQGVPWGVGCGRAVRSPLGALTLSRYVSTLSMEVFLTLLDSSVSLATSHMSCTLG